MISVVGNSINRPFGKYVKCLINGRYYSDIGFIGGISVYIVVWDETLGPDVKFLEFYAKEF